MKINGFHNDQESFVRLWRLLVRTKRYLRTEHKRFCIRRVLQTWLGPEATDIVIWRVCLISEQYGWDELPPPSLYPLKHREFLIAVASVCANIPLEKVHIKAVDKAYSKVFPHSTPINVVKKRPPSIPP